MMRQTVTASLRSTMKACRRELTGSKYWRYILEVRTMASCYHYFLVPFVDFTSDAADCIIGKPVDDYRHRHIANILGKDGVALLGSQLTIIAIGISHGMASR
jgi:hypothetical protein